jgi:hypothetical protein
MKVAMPKRTTISGTVLGFILVGVTVPVPMLYDWKGSDPPRGKPDRSALSACGPNEVKRKK